MLTRRRWLGATAGTGLFHIVPRRVLGGPGYQPPSEQVQVALVGAGGRGRQVLRSILQEPDVRVIAVADPAAEYSLQDFYYRDVGGRQPTARLIDEHYAASSSCRSYVDFRDMLASLPELDAVLCATPDHLHAFVSAHCLLAGKHVYCEKPLTHNIAEARYLSRLARQVGLATQMGNQGHATEGMRLTCEWIWAGAIGQPTRVEAWVGGHRWNPTLTGRPPESASPPDGLDWDLWLGPRDGYGFSSAYFPVAWRDFWAFGNSNIGDFGCHDLDAACWALDLQSPEYIEFHPAGPCNDSIGPHGCLGYFVFPPTDRRGPIEITWYDGGLKPRRPAGWPAGKPLPGRGVLFHGTEGCLYCGGAGGRPELIRGPKDWEPPAPSLPRVPSHLRDWLDAMRTNHAPGSNFQYGAQLSEIALLGALSLRTRKPIRWDGSGGKAVGLPEADRIIDEPVREGWQLPPLPDA
ncbi:MAG: oxidoreductase [Pirellulaceae bacterium]|nr:MAG: oxidoreductase [Pirellulaceae bacterium]